MRIELKDGHGRFAVLDNSGQVNGQIVITGDAELVGILDFNLNKRLDISLHVPTVGALPEHFILKEDGKPAKMFKASDAYLGQYFIPVVCPALGLEVVSQK
ncbi:MAG: hypothetical protein K0Q90_2001 [Paenibacillaceae bacterium]|jgi:hypothetical protein|nr:hypothetical protein [Paenibacillaceae bacterium]